APGRLSVYGSVDNKSAGQQLNLAAQWISETAPYEWAATAGLTPEQVDYDAKLQRIRIATPATDRIAEQLLTAKVIRHLNIVQPGIEEAFFSLTESTGQEVTS